MDKQDVAGLSAASMTFVVIQLSSGPIDMNETQLVFLYLIKVHVIFKSLLGWF